MAQLLTSNFDDLTPGGFFELSWVEAGGVVLSLHVLQDGITSQEYQIFIWETFNDTEPGITYSSGWNVPQNLRQDSQCQFNLKQKDTGKVYTYPAHSSFVITKDTTTLKSPAPTLLKTCSDSTSTDNCLPPITSVQPGSAIAATTKPAGIPNPSFKSTTSHPSPPASSTSSKLPITTVTTPTATSSTSSSSISIPPTNSASAHPVAASFSQVKGPGLVIGIGVGVGVGVLALLLCLGFFFLRYRKKKLKPPHSDSPPLNTAKSRTSPPPAYEHPKLYPNNEVAPSYMDTSSSSTDRQPALYSIYGSLEENNFTGGGTINGTVKRPSRVIEHELTPVYGRGREAGSGGRAPQLSAYESIYSQPDDLNFEERRETRFSGFFRNGGNTSTVS